MSKETELNRRDRRKARLEELCRQFLGSVPAPKTEPRMVLSLLEVFDEQELFALTFANAEKNPYDRHKDPSKYFSFNAYKSNERRSFRARVSKLAGGKK